MSEIKYMHLLPHNNEVYDKILESLNKTNKAIFEQATGTGKSYLAIQTIEDLEKNGRVLFVAPYNPILEQFKDNIKEEASSAKRITGKRYRIVERHISPQTMPKPKFKKSSLKHKDIEYSTYASLKNKVNEQYDLIIFDEAHRAGAKTWRPSVEQIVANNPNAKIVAMSATLEDRADKVKVSEIFGADPCSSFTLIDALKNRILNSPDYTLANVSFKDDSEFIDKSIRDLKAKLKNATDDEKQEINGYLKKLNKARKMISECEEIPDIFAKKLTTDRLKNGKYIVFCPAGNNDDDIADSEQAERIMGKMIAECPNWFEKVANFKGVKTYSVHSQTHTRKEALKEISHFEKDKSNGIKLLFSINMLNEGLHVKGIDGVIMLRGTTSKIIYLQQLGRALSVIKDKTKQPLIFDFVSNLRYVDIERMQAIAIGVNGGGNGPTGGNGDNYLDYADPFKLGIENLSTWQFIDTLRKNLYDFNHKNDFDFEDFYARLLEYKKDHIDVDVPLRYICKDHYPLGQKVSSIRKGNIRLTSDQWEKLNSIGFKNAIAGYDQDNIRFSVKKFVQEFLAFKEKSNRYPRKSADKDENSLYTRWSIYTNPHNLNEDEKKFINANNIKSPKEDVIHNYIIDFVNDYLEFIQKYHRKPRHRGSEPGETNLYQKLLKYTNPANINEEERQFIESHSIEIREKQTIENIRQSIIIFVDDFIKFKEVYKRNPRSTTESALYQRWFKYTNLPDLTNEEIKYLQDNDIEFLKKDIVRKSVKCFVAEYLNFVEKFHRTPNKSGTESGEGLLYNKTLTYLNPDNLSIEEQKYIQENGIKLRCEEKIRPAIIKFVNEYLEFIQKFKRKPRKRGPEDRELSLYQRHKMYTDPKNVNEEEQLYLKQHNIINSSEETVRPHISQFACDYLQFIETFGRKPKKTGFEKGEDSLYKKWVKYTNAKNLSEEEVEFLQEISIEVRNPSPFVSNDLDKDSK